MRRPLVIDLFQFAIARRYAQTKADPSTSLREVLRLERIVEQYEQAEQLEESRYRPLRPPVLGGGR